MHSSGADHVPDAAGKPRGVNRGFDIHEGPAGAGQRPDGIETLQILGIGNRHDQRVASVEIRKRRKRDAILMAHVPRCASGS